jgi:hypothetical protein
MVGITMSQLVHQSHASTPQPLWLPWDTPLSAGPTGPTGTFGPTGTTGPTGVPGPAGMGPSQTLVQLEPNGTLGGDSTPYIGVYLARILNAGFPALGPGGASTTIAGLVLDTFTSRISIRAGTYVVDACCPVVSVGRHRARLYDAVNGIVLAVASNSYESNGVYEGDTSNILGTIVIPNNTELELQHQVEGAFIAPNVGMGLAMNFGDDEVFSQIRFTKIS